jgi:hypothetical protein
MPKRRMRAQKSLQAPYLKRMPFAMSNRLAIDGSSLRVPEMGVDIAGLFV